MIKKFSMLALAGLIALPVVASAGMGPQSSDLDRKIQDLSAQLDQLKAQMASQAEANAPTSAKVGDLNNTVTGFSERAEDWDLAARFKLDGDFRARMDYYNADTVFGDLLGLGELGNDTAFTNRFRLNMRVGITENVDFKGRLAMYKSWGQALGYFDQMAGMDGNSTRTPGDNALRVDRAFVNFNNLFGAPVWFSIGRRPTTDGNPANMRMNLDERSGTPLIMDYAFDGISMGYAYKWGGDLGSGRVRVCYGRGFEDGLTYEDSTVFNPTGIDDTDFIGLSWDILKKGDRFLYAQSFNASNMPEFGQSGPTLENNGNIQHSGALYMDKIAGLNYFVSGGWSRTDPNDNGMFNDYIFGSGPNTDSKNGYMAHVGIRYDIDQAGLKLGAEWNHGSEYWIGMTPGHDDLYQSKIAARGNVYEVYGIYDLPMGEKISKYAKTFMRLGYQRYEYDYSGSNDWNMAPYDLSDDAGKLALFYLGQDPVESADQVYLTLEASF
jgi:hypothetical protein